MAWPISSPSEADAARITKRAEAFRDALLGRVAAQELTSELAGRLMDAHQEGMADVAKALTETSAHVDWGSVVRTDRDALVKSIDPNFYTNLQAAKQLQPAGIA